MALKSRIPAIARVLPKALDKAAEETAKLVKKERDRLVPYDSGDLLESGEALPGPQLGHWFVEEGAGLPDARASYTEYGTDKQDAQPHMTPAAELGRKALPANVKKHVKAVMP
jgi:hypothetical protein